MARRALNTIGRLARQALDRGLSEEERLEAAKEMVNWRIHRGRQLLDKLKPSPARDAAIALCDRIAEGDKRYQQITGRTLSNDSRESGSDDEGELGESSGKAKRCGVLLVTPAARRIVFVFGGNAGRFHIAPAYTDRKDCHIMFLRDPSRCFSLCEIPGVGEDYEQNLSTFRQVAKGLDATEIYCVGYSAGAYPALRYGLDLGAIGVLSVAGPSTLDISPDPTLTLKDYPQLWALYQRARHLAVDLVPLYAKAPNPPKVLALYGAAHKRDAMLALRMASLPTVTLEPLSDFSGHNVSRELTQLGEFQAYVERVIPPPPQEVTPAEAAD